ncbi:aldose epimerase family protein [Flavobacterium paronense]|uniref:Aldose 1-epimerase n=1 Tax=Flavobacterium paronense TaxID=1392775 RepID=A0ABV5GEF7_9FLAO|nr:aldose epimerase family protein [Flavobacterium paronense]MDN3678307.1 aldose epimerase family protein [Flavobacterium paronense]
MIKNNFSQITSSINAKLFGFTPDGKEVSCYIMTNKKGTQVGIINYGATITSLKIPIADGEKIDVVLGFDNLENYINSYHLPSPPYFGTTIGRFAGRINEAEFELNNERNFLNKNHGVHSLHGGILGFGRKIWRVIATSTEENPSITLQYISQNNEENFPGELTVQVTYTLTEENELKVAYTATTSEDTLVNLTQHSYFNLDGHSNAISSQKLIINSKKILETNDELIPTGNFVSLKNHSFDFAEVKPTPTSIDNTFVLEDENAVTLISEKNNLKMSVITNQPAVHIYVGGNCFDKIKGKENANYNPKSGICFETQNFPDAPNHAHFPNSILKKGEQYNHQTTFKFESI